MESSTYAEDSRYAGVATRDYHIFPRGREVIGMLRATAIDIKLNEEVDVNI